MLEVNVHAIDVNLTLWWIAISWNLQELELFIFLATLTTMDCWIHLYNKDLLYFTW